MSETASGDLREAMNRVRVEVGKAVVGQDGAVTGLLIALLAGPLLGRSAGPDRTTRPGREAAA